MPDGSGEVVIAKAVATLRMEAKQALKAVFQDGKGREVQAAFDGQSVTLTGKKISVSAATTELLSAGMAGDALLLRYVDMRRAKWKMRVVKLKSGHREELARWEADLSEALEAHRGGRPRRLLVFVNPFGGKGRASKVWKRRAAPVFRAAGVDCEVVETRSATHASEAVVGPGEGELEAAYDGVVAVGGDGMFNQVFDALVRRRNAELFEKMRVMSLRRKEGRGDPVPDDATIEQEPIELSPPELRVGVIPAGSTDSVSYTLHGTSSAETAALHIALGDRRGVDVMGVTVAGRLRYLAMTIVSRGFFGDNLVWSEQLRWMGPTRYELAGAVTFLNNKGHKGTISMLKDCTSHPSDPDACSDECDCGVDERAGDQPDGAGDRGLRRETVRGKFAMVTGACIACKCERAPGGLSSGAHLGDGRADLILVRRTSRLNVLRFLLRVGRHHLSPLDLDCVESHRVAEFTFTPDRGGNRKKKKKESVAPDSAWNCDGEILWAGGGVPVEVRVHRRLVQVFARGPPPPPRLQAGDEKKSLWSLVLRNKC